MTVSISRDYEQFWLRPLDLGDIPTIAGWYEQVEDLSMFHRRMPLPLSASAIEATWRQVIVAPEPRSSYWFTLQDDERNVVGLGGIEDINYAHANAITPLFIDRSVRKKGLAVRLRGLLLDLAFHQLALARITSIHRADNQGSLRVNQACGLREEGRLRSAWRKAGGFVDVLILGILAEEWQEHRTEMRRKLASDTVVTLGTDPSGFFSWPAVSS